MAAKNEVDTKRFEEAMSELEAIVGRLESGELTLEDALATFERGIGLVRLLNEKLNQAEKRVEVLTRDATGAVRLQATAEPDEEAS
jgi:exodeoxyribonuclease VII small subunit